MKIQVPEQAEPLEKCVLMLELSTLQRMPGSLLLPGGGGSDSGSKTPC